MRVLTQLGHFCLRTSQYRIACVGLAFLAALGCPCRGKDSHAVDKRRITVRDTIEMTEFADRGYFLGGAPASPVAIFSPDGKQFIIRLKKGDVEQNVVKYWLLLFQTNEVFRSAIGSALVTMSSSSNREAIQQVRWLDNQTVVFLGENAGDSPQVYRVDASTRRAIQLTHHPTAVVSYDISRDGRAIAYEAVPSPNRVLEDEQVRRRGLVITSQSVDDHLNDGQARDDPRTDRELDVQAAGQAAFRIPSSDFLTEYLPLVLSSDGHYAVIAVYLSCVLNS